MNQELLAISLSAAVPLWIEEFKRRPWSELIAIAKEACQIVAEKGDIIQYRSKKAGETAKAFNALARGIAVLAFSPGGIDCFGLHFEAEHKEKGALRGERPSVSE
jgi:hypothetical protein